jgi:cytochrome c oxidase subunit 2
MNRRMFSARQIATVTGLLLALGILGVALVCMGGIPLLAPGEKVISITARRFQYEPAIVTLRRGEPVILELHSIDVVHGFNLPDLGVRTDVLPGQARRVRIIPDRVGTFGFHCDNFCGIGHEEMAGVLTVIE